MNIKVNNIGYWYNDREAKDFPMPIANSANPKQLIKMMENLERFNSSVKTNTLFCKGFSICRICGCVNGSSEHVQAVNGTVTRIPDGLRHYIAEHKVLVKELLDLY